MQRFLSALRSAEGIKHFHSEKEFKICLFP